MSSIKLIYFQPIVEESMWAGPTQIKEKNGPLHVVSKLSTGTKNLKLILYLSYLLWDKGYNLT
jgi:hypothetical protein